MIRLLQRWEINHSTKDGNNDAQQAVDFVLQVGNLEPHRHADDLATMAAPSKHRRLGDFYKVFNETDDKENKNNGLTTHCPGWFSSLEEIMNRGAGWIREEEERESVVFPFNYVIICFFSAVPRYIRLVPCGWQPCRESNGKDRWRSRDRTSRYFPIDLIRNTFGSRWVTWMHFIRPHSRRRREAAGILQRGGLIRYYTMRLRSWWLVVVSLTGVSG
jgi:hypothetical protein